MTNKTWLAVGIIIGLVAGLSLFLIKKPGYSVDYQGYAEPAKPVATYSGPPPRNVIVFVADGMGFGQLSLAMLASPAETSVWQRFSVRSWYDARPLRGPISDSAAGATALATGALTQPGRVSVDVEGEPLQSAFELATKRGWHTGIVTDSYIWDATPAAFTTHAVDRGDAASILRQQAMSELMVLFGELEDVGEDEVPDWAATEAILKQRFTLLDAKLTLPKDVTPNQPLAAVFPEDSIEDQSSVPTLRSMTALALERLAAMEGGFMLLVESEEFDSAGHRGDSRRLVSALGAIEDTLTLIMDFAQQRGDTLVLVVSDHETGGLALTYDRDTYPAIEMKWATRDHTSVFVPLLAEGPGAETFQNISRIWQVGEGLKGLVTSPDD